MTTKESELTEDVYKRMGKCLCFATDVCRELERQFIAQEREDFIRIELERDIFVNALKRAEIWPLADRRIDSFKSMLIGPETFDPGMWQCTVFLIAHRAYHLCYDIETF